MTMTDTRPCPRAHAATPHEMRQTSEGRWYCPIELAAEQEKAHNLPEPTLFEGLTIVPAIESTFTDERARARKSDPVTSHRAADKSAETRSQVEEAVLQLVRQEGVLTGSEINALYRLRMERAGWPLVHPDSPRKRAGELATPERRALAIVNEDAPRGTEREYTLPADTKQVAA